MTATQPSELFDNQREGELAQKIWEIAGTLATTKSGNTKSSIHKKMLSVPWMSRRIVHARDWITYYREFDSKGGVESVNQTLKSHFSQEFDFRAREIASVEHFYVGALLGTFGGPFGGIALGGIAAILWEGVVGPVRHIWKDKDGLTMTDMKHEFEQAAGPDSRGTWFGALYQVTGGQVPWVSDEADLTIPANKPERTHSAGRPGNSLGKWR